MEKKQTLENLLWEFFSISNEKAFKSTLKRVTPLIKKFKEEPIKKSTGSKIEEKGLALRPVIIIRENFVYYDPIVFESHAELQVFAKEMQHQDKGKKEIVVDIMCPTGDTVFGDFKISKSMFGKFTRRFNLQRNYHETRKAYYNEPKTKKNATTNGKKN